MSRDKFFTTNNEAHWDFAGKAKRLKIAAVGYIITYYRLHEAVGDAGSKSAPEVQRLRVHDTQRSPSRWYTH